MAAPAIKGPGSKYKKIEHVQSFKIVYTRRSRNLEAEYTNYSYKIDRYGLTTDEIDPSCPNHLMDALGYIVSYLVNYLQIAFV